MIPIDLTGKTALITGGGQGLGAATAAVLADAGCRIVVNYFNDAAGVNRQRAEETCAALSNEAISIEADVRNAEAVEAMFDHAIARFGALDIVVNNAAIIKDRTLKKMSIEEWQSVLDTNLSGVFNVCHQAAEKVADGGRIVNFSSITASAGFFGQANYAASKAGVSAMTRVLSKELAKRGITVNDVAPGVVLTEMGKTIPEPVRDSMLAQIPLGRFGEPEEIAHVVLFLVSNLASYMTGQTLHVSGGWRV
ncbi:MAG: 3-oxoacyl-ACP reductase FabG [Lentisphaerae bacterium]|nr:3-oxoacyl-ACP reductase FabG [Lentisphaerota bacterium]